MTSVLAPATFWLTPHSPPTKPSYQQKHFPALERHGKLQLIASKTGQAGSLKILQDTKIYAGNFSQGESQVLVLDLRATGSAPSRKQSFGGCKTQACARRR
ncbi:hypothetical protein [Pseudomonas putida]|uniref:pirin family protein n=1 Tax=Pseudomonas putida TaxID=303 RepID=UPI0032EA6467|nr:hypothetical protein [Pseudomonas putida]